MTTIEVHVITTLGATDLPGVRHQAQIGDFKQTRFAWADYIHEWEERWHTNSPCFVDPIFIHRPRETP